VWGRDGWTKSVNYLQNAMVVADAHERGADYGIWAWRCRSTL